MTIDNLIGKLQKMHYQDRENQDIKELYYGASRMKNDYISIDFIEDYKRAVIYEDKKECLDSLIREWFEEEIGCD